MNKQQLLKNLTKDIYCKIGKSKIHGVGVIAIRDIPKGTNPFIGSPQDKYITFSEKELKNLPPEIKKMVSDFFIFDGKYFLVPAFGLNSINISYFMNHSKTPNIQTDKTGENCYTMQDIKKGEELTINYIKDYGKENVKYL